MLPGNLHDNVLAMSLDLFGYLEVGEKPLEKPDVEWGVLKG